MCLDYIYLNRITVKDKSLIPIIDELFDELHGEFHFKKMDLHLGYHQIIMKEESIFKTTLRTHEYNY